MFSSLGNRRGFSLIELSLIIAIAGLLLASVSGMYSQYITAKISGNTSQNRDLISAQLSAHLLVFGNLPCPAAPKIAPGQPNGGQADCSISQGNLTALPTAQIPPTNLSACDPITGICTTPGHRASPAGLHYNGGNQFAFDPVLIGSIPWVDLGMPVSYAMDGYGNRFTYAVSFYLTQVPAVQWASTQNLSANQLGAINIEVASPAITPGFNPDTNICPGTYCLVPGTYMLALVSHGQDGAGAYNWYGNLVKPCPVGGTAPNFTNGLDVENCNGDSTFLLSSSNTTGNLFNPLPGASHYDDNLALYDISITADKWSVAGGNQSITNAGGGLVGIGPGFANTPPQYQLDINGPIQVDQGVQAGTICDAAGNNCMPTSLLLGAPAVGTNTCPNGALMTGISNNTVQCATQVNSTNLNPAGSTCPVGQLATGIDATGSLVCVLPP